MPVPEAVSASSPAPSVSAAKAAASKLTDHFDSFLSLLTTQLKNQDPLSPMDTETFTQQLVQFTSVEQSIKANDNLERLIGLVRGTSQTSALGYLGTTVQASSDQISLAKDGPATIGYELPADAAGLSVKIHDQAGRLVAETRGPTTAGPHQISWDGSGTDGRRMPAGTYRVAIAATSAAGGDLEVTQTVRGTVDAIDPSSDPPVLSVGGIDVAISQVTAIARPQ